MGCKAPLPAGYQLKIAHFLAGQLAQKTSDVGDARQHVQRAINALGGIHGKHYKVDHDVKNPVHGLGDGAIPYLELMVAQRIEGAKEAHEIAQIAHKVLALCLDPQNGISDVQRLSTAGSLLLQAALEVINF